MKKYYYILITIFVFSCNGENVKTKKQGTIIKKVIDSNYEYKHFKDNPTTKTINIKRIKSDADYVTTTFLPKNKTKNYVFKDKKFYVLIHLIKKKQK